jgi:hypothetical protein
MARFFVVWNEGKQLMRRSTVGAQAIAVIVCMQVFAVIAKTIYD